MMGSNRPAKGEPMDLRTDFAEIVKANEPLAPYTYLRLGGPADWLIQPRSREELSAVVRRCFDARVPLRVLGGGCNVLVRDEGVRGAVLRLHEPAFTEVGVEGRRVRAGTGAAVSALISQAARHGLAGLETLVGIPGTVGGALRCNAGDRSGDFGQFVRLVEVLDSRGAVQVRERDELRFAPHWSNLDDPVLLTAEFELEPDQADAIVKRMLKAWIQRRAAQPLSFQAAGRLFQNPRGLNAAGLIVQAGLAKTRVGGAELSERDANYVVVHPGASARDVLRLIDLVRSRVQERFGVELELEITVW
jgi:UDP-N-acetylmuramate dehydrogenase